MRQLEEIGQVLDVHDEAAATDENKHEESAAGEGEQSKEGANYVGITAEELNCLMSKGDLLMVAELEHGTAPRDHEEPMQLTATSCESVAAGGGYKKSTAKSWGEARNSKKKK